MDVVVQRFDCREATLHMIYPSHPTIQIADQTYVANLNYIRTIIMKVINLENYFSGVSP